ncbi:MAG: protein kinase [Planctomycetota bacterium]|jgi:serine/threonine protein kinase|nr:protein kinase [Planctomycetota bacterium]
MAKLRVVDGPLTGTEYALKGGPAAAGRHADCAVPIPDPRVSRNHAEFIPDDNGDYAIIDLGSANGTSVNGIPLSPGNPRALCGGDEIRMGRNTFRFFSGDARIPNVDIPGFTLEDILAEGGMGSICRAKRKDTGQEVAIKILHRGYARHEEFVNRFIQEARASERLSHPHIVKVFNVGKTDNGRYYYSMELVRGPTLTQKIPSLKREEALTIFMEIADALEYAHRRGIIHRDIKPDNILIGEYGEPKLTDLGIAVLDQAEMIQTGQRVLGTPHYMSPEQASGGIITAATDVYSLGATFFHVLSGSPLFDAATPEQIMIKHVRERPRSLAEAVPDFPPEISAIVDRTLEKDPARRYAGAGRLRDELAKRIRVLYPDLLRGELEDERRKSGGGTMKWAAAAAILLLLAAAICFFLW